MKYKCQTISLAKIILDTSGMHEPICTHCEAGDCTNPIEFRDISFFGELKRCRVYVRGKDVHAVIGCEGFLS